MTDSIVCTLGQYDIPIIQMQPPFKVDLLYLNLINQLLLHEVW